METTAKKNTETSSIKQVVIKGSKWAAGLAFFGSAAATIAKSIGTKIDYLTGGNHLADTILSGSITVPNINTTAMVSLPIYMTQHLQAQMLGLTNSTFTHILKSCPTADTSEIANAFAAILKSGMEGIEVDVVLKGFSIPLSSALDAGMIEVLKKAPGYVSDTAASYTGLTGTAVTCALTALLGLLALAYSQNEEKKLAQRNDQSKANQPDAAPLITLGL